MAEETLYRKYRPHQFKDVVGQEHVVKALEGALEEGKVGHAYLFYGSRGTGKTSVARIFARELGAADVDIHEIDAATYTSVDNIRQLREEINNLPFGGERTVYIVDEVHMLSKAAFNAFLKTLEEPPAHAVFILATTELEKVPDTILSRCQVFTFRKPGVKALADVVARVAKSEGFTLEKASAELIALIAAGSFRDALSTLQKILASSTDTKVSVEEVETVTGAPKGVLISHIIEGLSKGNAEQALQAVGEAVASEADMAILATLLLERVRILLLLRYAPTFGADLAADLTDADRSTLEALAKDKESKINSETLKKLIEAAIGATRAPLPHLPLELAIMELTSAVRAND